MLKKVTEENFDYRRVVVEGYNSIAEKYMASRVGESERSLSLVFDNVPRGSHVLDVGCGSGIPVARTLSKAYEVTGIDISKEQIRLARRNVRKGDFICIDVLEYDPPADSYSAIVSFYTLFHIPKEKHEKVVKLYYDWLVPSGWLVMTVASKDEKAYTEDDFFDTTMYWSNYGKNQYTEMLSKVGFQVMNPQIVELGYDEGILQTEGEVHPIIVAKKKRLTTARGGRLN